MAADICGSCRTYGEIVLVEEATGRSFCERCAPTITVPDPSVAAAMLFLDATVPFAVGDRVEARTAATIFDGVGTVDKVSTLLENGGTPVYPSFHVVLAEKAHDKAPDDAWYTEICLTRVED